MPSFDVFLQASSFRFYTLLYFKAARLVSLSWTGETIREYKERFENIHCILPFTQPTVLSVTVPKR
jgi:hypothetical protein